MKRSRGELEAANRAEQAPYAYFGTPLPAFDSEARDDGSFLPLWKQEVRDEQGRKRLHGAFTGGFSAGYFNTVGSKEGWTPSTFVSSRSNRNKDSAKPRQQTAEDFMDDEDMADAAEAQRVKVAGDYAGLGSTEEETAQQTAFLGLFKTEGETMGVKLLKKMGWREGQGIGPKVRRRARLDGASHAKGGESEETHLFAPENTYMVRFLRKTDHKGLGFDGETRLDSQRSAYIPTKSEDEDAGTFGTLVKAAKPKKKSSVRGGIGIGILNDTGSDDEDPYAIGPQISYNKVIGGDKKKKKSAVNGSAGPVFISKKAATARAALGLRKCHDGRLPLEGFTLSSDSGFSSSISPSEGRYSPPQIPTGWVSTKRSTTPASKPSSFLSTADAAKASKLDPKARAALLGEAALPGKSVFDFLSASARDRLATASGKSNLPIARGEIPAGYDLTPQQQQQELLNQVPSVEKETAIAALGRRASGFMPYSEDEPKRSRYRFFLETQAGTREGLPDRASGMSTADWLQELHEFAKCAQIFKPMTGIMANRFTSSSSTSLPGTDAPSSASALLSRPQPKAEDPAEAAAKVGMFGPMTRSSQDFYPTRLLCKRFNVRPPAHVQLDPERAAEDGGGVEAHGSAGATGKDKDLELLGKTKLEDMMKVHWEGVNSQRAAAGLPQAVRVEVEQPKEPLVQPDVNEALEGQKAGEAVFRAIFGDSDDDDDDD